MICDQCGTDVLPRRRHSEPARVLWHPKDRENSWHCECGHSWRTPETNPEAADRTRKTFGMHT